MGVASRIVANLFRARGALRRQFDPATLIRIQQAIEDGERTHAGEIVFAVESRLSPFEVLQGVDARGRALDAFAQLRVWDTQANTGVLVYVLLAEHRIELVADRGIHARVDPAEWRRIGELVADGFRRDAPADGVVAAVNALHALLRTHFPAPADNPRELPDRPIVL